MRYLEPNKSTRWLLALIALLFLISCDDNNNLLGNDIRLFDKVSGLAAAVASQDIEKIEKIVSKQSALLNYQEPRFGQTLLIWAILNDRYKSAEKLLRLGADPDLQNYNGLSALMYAAEWSVEEWKGDPKYLRLVLRYGGNPNAISNPKVPPARLQTPLIAAVNSLSLENVKILISAGADPDYADSCNSALAAAFNLGQIDMVRYLVIERNVDVRSANCEALDGKSITVATYLREMRYPLDSREYRVKMEVVEFLTSKGVDYRKEPIPKHFYKIHNPEYLKKY
jgi:ankyrin repeat protein